MSDSSSLPETVSDEAALRASEARYRTLVENTPDIIMRFDRRYRHVFVSSNVEAVTGIEGDHFIGKTHRELGFSEERSAFWEDAVEQVFQSGEDRETEFEFDSIKGRLIFNWRLIPEKNASGQTECVLSISRDITEHRTTEQEYGQLFALMPGGFAVHEIMVDVEGRPCNYRFLHVNPAFEEFTGLKAVDIVGRTVLDVLPGTEASWIERYGQVALSGRPVTFEQYSAELGRYYEVTAYSPRSGQFATVFHDITDRVRAQALIQQNSFLMRIAGRAARMGGWQVNIKENSVIWSDVVAAIHDRPSGYSPSLIEGISYYTPAWHDRITAVFTACAEQGIPYDEEAEIITAKGRHVWVRTIGEAERDASGNIIGVQGAFMDISERKRSEACVFESENRHRNLFMHSPDAIFINHKDTVIQANLACLKLFGAQEEEELLGKSPFELFHPDYHERIRERIYQLRVLGTPVPIEEEKIMRLDGQIVDVEVLAAPFPYEGKNDIHVILRDITERIEAREQLARAAAEWQRTFNATHHAIWIMDKDFKVLRANEATQRFVEVTAEQTLGRPCYSLLHDTDEYIEKCPMRKAIKSLSRESMDLQLGDRWVEVIVDPIINEKGCFDGAVHILNDITDRKQAEQALIDKYDDLQRFNKVTVNRELRMLALKQEVNALLEQAGKPPRYEARQ